MHQKEKKREREEKRSNYTLCTTYETLTSNNETSDIEAPCEIVKLSKIQRQGKKFHDCSYEIKRHLFLEGKAMTNQDSILKSKDITLTNKGPSSQIYGFPLVMYGCESWTIKKAEC